MADKGPRLKFTTVANLDARSLTPAPLPPGEGTHHLDGLGSVDVSLVVALLVKIAPDKARPTTCGGSTRGGRNAVWRDFDQQPFGTGL